MTTTDPQDARTRRRHTIRWLLNLASLTPAGRADLRTAVEAEIADADQVRDALDTMCAEVRRLSTKLGEARNANDEWQQESERRRAAVSEALGLGTSAPWEAIADRAAIVKTAAYERAELLEAARDALSTAGQNGPHADDWPAIAPGIEALAAERDAVAERYNKAAISATSLTHAANEKLRRANAWLSGRERELEQRAEQAEAAIERARKAVAIARQHANPMTLACFRCDADTNHLADIAAALDGTGDADGANLGALTAPIGPREPRPTSPDHPVHDLWEALTRPTPYGPEEATGLIRAYYDAITSDPPETARREPEPQPERCCVCGSTTVVYRNFEDNPFCGSCANCRCGANPCARTGINDPAVSAEAAEPEATCLGCGHTVPSEGCGCPSPQPTAPRPLVISIDLSDTAIANAIRRAVQRTSRAVQRHPGSPS